MEETRPTSLRRSRSVGDAPIAQLTPEQSNNDSRATSSVVVTTPEKRTSGPNLSHSLHSAPLPQSIPEDSSSSTPQQSPFPLSPPQPAVLQPPDPNAATTIQPLPSNVIQDRPAVQPYQPPRSIFGKMLLFLGYGRGASRTRRLLVSLIWNMSWGFVQIVTIITVLATFASKPSPTLPGVNEWTACERPLGVWLCLWISRVFLASSLAYWSWTRDRAAHANRTDTEAGRTSTTTSSRSSPAPRTGPIVPSDNVRNHPTEPASDSSHSSEAPPLPHSLLYRRLSLLSSLMGLTWFLTAHILVYTSTNTCRFSAPHIWWLTFAILCITYLVILEVLVLGLVVFVIAPVLFLIWNIFLICIGRHPLQNPHTIKPEIGKLPKSMVDNIPLVIYIPPPPDAPPSEGPMKIPDAAYSYPPKPPPTQLLPSKRRFKFIRKFPKPRQKGNENVAPGSGSKETSKTGEPLAWEDHWEKEDYPFVVLEGNRAACAICLMDFEEPKRLHRTSDDNLKSKTTVTVGEAPAPDHESHPDGNIAEENRHLQLEDAGEGAQPLRLLTCGHVFHKTCLDPWLIDVSGRCPTCQRPVEFPVPPKKKKKSNR